MKNIFVLSLLLITLSKCNSQSANSNVEPEVKERVIYFFQSLIEGKIISKERYSEFFYIPYPINDSLYGKTCKNIEESLQIMIAAAKDKFDIKNIKFFYYDEQDEKKNKIQINHVDKGKTLLTTIKHDGVEQDKFTLIIDKKIASLISVNKDNRIYMIKFWEFK
jgi:hypothetical protein